MMFPPARRRRLVRSNLQSFEKPPQGSFPIYPAFPLAFGKVIDLAYCSTAIFALQERFSNFSRYFLCYIRFLAPSAATDCSHSVSRGTCIPRLSLVYYVQKLDVFNRINISHRKENESFCFSSKMTSFVIVYPKCFRGAVVFRFPLGTRS